MTSLAGEAPILVVTGLIFLVIARRAIQMARGVPYSTPRLVAQACLFLFLFGFTILFDLEFLPAWMLAIDTALLAPSAGIATRHVRRVIQFDQRADGQWMYRLGILLPAIYLGLYAVRLAVEIVVVPAVLTGSGTIPLLDPLQQYALAGVDGLFAVSAGLLVGRSFGVYEAYSERMRNLPPIPSGPPPPPSLPF
jgi:hypothetical protein